MDYTELLPPLPVCGYELTYQGRSDLTKHEANAQVWKARGGHAEPLVRRSDALAAIAAAAPAIRKAERERCIGTCEEVESQAWALWKTTADPTEQGRSIGAGHCADAIRALPEEP